MQDNLLTNGQVVRGEATSIDTDQKLVTLDDGKTVPYDYVSNRTADCPCHTHHVGPSARFCVTLPLAWWMKIKIQPEFNKIALQKHAACDRDRRDKLIPGGSQR
jgi:hypothetical protein